MTSAPKTANDVLNQRLIAKCFWSLTGSLVAERHPMVGRSTGHPDGHQRYNEANAIGQQMGGIGHNSQTAGHVAADDFGHLNEQNRTL